MRRDGAWGGAGSGRGGGVRRDGGAYVVEVCPRTTFKFAIPATGGDSVIPIVDGIPAYDWVSGILGVRVHSVASWVNTTLKIEVNNVSMTDDDPSVVFKGTGAATAVSFTGASAPPSGRITVAQLVTPIGPMLGVGFVVSTFTGGGTIEIALSIELVGRTS